jgi:hypothetical protein
MKRTIANFPNSAGGISRASATRLASSRISVKTRAETSQRVPWTTASASWPVDITSGSPSCGGSAPLREASSLGPLRGITVPTTRSRPRDFRRYRAGDQPRELLAQALVRPRLVEVQGVTIGAHAVIGAGSVVTTSIPAGVIAAGNPARVIREL